MNIYGAQCRKYDENDLIIYDFTIDGSTVPEDISDICNNFLNHDLITTYTISPIAIGFKMSAADTFLYNMLMKLIYE